MFHSRTKHVEVDYYYVQERVAQKLLEIQFCICSYKVENGLTKALQLSKLKDFFHILNLNKLWLRRSVRDKRIDGYVLSLLYVWSHLWFDLWFWYTGGVWEHSNPYFLAQLHKKKIQTPQLALLHSTKNWLHSTFFVELLGLFDSTPLPKQSFHHYVKTSNT